MALLGRSVLYFLHGSGGCGRDMRSFLESLPLPDFNNQTFRQVLDSLHVDLETPTARSRSYAPADGDNVAVWFDRSRHFIAEGLRSSEDVAGADASLAWLQSRIREREAAYDHLFVAGFSMGGGLALHSYRQPPSPKLRAVVTMGSFLVDASAVYAADVGATRHVPLLMLHGDADSLIDVRWGRRTAAQLQQKDIDVQFHVYPRLDHDMSAEQLSDALRFLQHVLRQLHATPRRELQEAKAREVAAATEPLGFAFRIEQTAGGGAVLHYHAPAHLVPVLVSRPVLACGACFDVLPETDLHSDGVKVQVVSADVRKTAEEIGKRLQLRVHRGSADLNPCPTH